MIRPTIARDRIRIIAYDEAFRFCRRAGEPHYDNAGRAQRLAAVIEEAIGHALADAGVTIDEGECDEALLANSPPATE